MFIRYEHTHTHTHTHARAHTQTHAHAHTHTHTCTHKQAALTRRVSSKRCITNHSEAHIQYCDRYDGNRDDIRPLALRFLLYRVVDDESGILRDKS